MTVPYLPLNRITAMHADEIHKAVSHVIDSGWYLRGEATARFEESYARYIGTHHCIAVANGLDALTLILRAYIELGLLREGDEVIVPANTYIATILAITENRLVPVLVEPRLDTFQIDDRLIEQAITSRTRALMLVHLYGRCAYTEHIAAICRHHHLILLEDNAQAHGAAPAHGFYPGKNLGALGDGGAVTTNDTQLAAVIRSMANYGSSRKYVFDYRGRNSRLDELQAAVLSVKLRYLDADNRRRCEIAAYYINHVENPCVTLPKPSPCPPSHNTLGCSAAEASASLSNVYHIFPVLTPRREQLQHYLSGNGVQTVVHYPIPPHRQRCYPEWHALSLPITEHIHREELSLPCHPAMTRQEVDRVVELLNAFEGKEHP